MHTLARPITALALSLGVVGATHGAGETIVVTTLEDVADVSTAALVSDLPGPDGTISFREAVYAANNTAGPQTIHFNIPQSEWWLLPDVAMLRLEDGSFYVTGDDTTIDFTSQTAFTGDTNLGGREVGIYGLQPNGWGAPAIHVEADRCIVKGLGPVMQRGHGVVIGGADNHVIDCVISGPWHAAVQIGGAFSPGMPTGNVIGGVQPGEGNVLSSGGSGVRIEAPAEYNLVVGNRISGAGVGVELVGSIYTDVVRNNRVGGPTAAERNIIAGGGSYCCEGYPSGRQVSVQYGDGNLIEGNHIGVDADGVTTIPAIDNAGVHVLHSINTIIRGNVIAGIVSQGVNHFSGDRFGNAIDIHGETSGLVIEDNIIGRDATDSIPLPNHRGVSFATLQGDPRDSILVGNTIAHSELEGVLLATNIRGVSIIGNRIYGNGALGVDLIGAANNNQSAPMIDGATVSGAAINVAGTLAAAPNQTFDLEFFASVACDGSGGGEAEYVLGNITVMTDASGQVAFDATLPAPPAAATVVSAIATRLDTGDSSEFAICRNIELGRACPGDMNNDGLVDFEDLNTVLTAWDVTYDFDHLNNVLMQWNTACQTP